jgi:ligand-binding sensor domain-containing protein
VKPGLTYLKAIFVLILAFAFFSCNQPAEKSSAKGDSIFQSPQTNLPKDVLSSESEFAESPAVKRSYPSNYHQYTRDTNLVSQYIRCIFQDSKGDLWFGSVGDGVIRYDGSSLVYFSKTENLSGNCIQAIAEDKLGNLWFGTDGGLSKYDGTKFTNFSEKEGIKSNYVLSLLIDRSGSVWVGNSEGIYRCDLSSNEKVFTNFPIRATGSFKSIIEDKLGNLWFASNNDGVFRYDRKTLSHISKKDGLRNDSVGHILQDKKGDLWFSTGHKGVSRYNGNFFMNYTRESGLCGNSVLISYEDRSGNIWFSANAAAKCRLCCYNGTSFTSFTEEDGLTDLCVQSFCEDKAGNLWIGSGGGLFRFDAAKKRFTSVTKKGPWPKKFR